MARFWRPLALAAAAAGLTVSILGIASLYLPLYHAANTVMDATVALLWQKVLYNGVRVYLAPLETHVLMLFIAAVVYIIDLTLSLVAAYAALKGRARLAMLAVNVTALTGIVNLAPVKAATRIALMFIPTLKAQETFTTNAGVIFYGETTVLHGPAWKILAPDRPLCPLCLATYTLLALSLAALYTAEREGEKILYRGE